MSDPHLFHHAPIFRVNDSFHTRQIELELVQGVAGGGFREVLAIDHHTVLHDGLPPEKLIDELNRRMARRLADCYINFLRRNPYHV